MGGGNTYFPCDLVCSCNSYFHNQFSGALSSHNFISNHSDGPLCDEVDDPVMFVLLLFLLQTVYTPAVCKSWI
jgi:hypothetical protein